MQSLGSRPLSGPTTACYSPKVPEDVQACRPFIASSPGSVTTPEPGELDGKQPPELPGVSRLQLRCPVPALHGISGQIAPNLLLRLSSEKKKKIKKNSQPWTLGWGESLNPRCPSTAFGPRLRTQVIKKGIYSVPGNLGYAVQRFPEFYDRSNGKVCLLLRLQRAAGPRQL